MIVSDNNKKPGWPIPSRLFAKGWAAVRSHIEKFCTDIKSEEAYIERFKPSTHKIANDKRPTTNDQPNFSLSNHRNITNPRRPKNPAIAFNLRWRPQRLRVVVGELYRGLAFHCRHLADQAHGVKIAEIGR